MTKQFGEMKNFAYKSNAELAKDATGVIPIAMRLL
jgi:hypothetical protein